LFEDKEQNITELFTVSREGVMPVAGKIVLITGASRGIGRSIASSFAAERARVAVHYNQNKKAANETLAGLSGDGHRLFQANLAEAGATKDMITNAIREMGHIDILVNNAGIFEEYPFKKLNYQTWQETWQRTLNCNLVGAANTCFLIANHMIDRGGGKIINISSRGAFRGEPEAPAYGASKAGLNAMSQSLAQALAPYNIYVYVVAPGFIKTDMTERMLVGKQGQRIKNQSPLGRVGYMEEVARTVLFLAGEGTDYLTGAIIDVNGASYFR
jgi:3-oxoacyl-[acyl-carrier protein] reductase